MVGDCMTSSTRSFWSEIKVVWKNAKWQYFLKFFTSIAIRAILLIIPLLFSEAINLVTHNDYNKSIIILIITMIMAGLYRFFEGFNQVAYYKLYNKLFKYHNGLAVSKTNDNSLFSLSRFTPGQYTNIVTTDVDIISSFFTASVIRVVQVIEFLVIYVYFFSLDINIFIVTVIVSIIMLFIAIKSGKNVQVLNEKRKQSLCRTPVLHVFYFYRQKVRPNRPVCTYFVFLFS
jgi:ABC-type multidrug transport system fused ATPase/permease subunit